MRFSSKTPPPARPEGKKKKHAVGLRRRAERPVPVPSHPPSLQEREVARMRLRDSRRDPFGGGGGEGPCPLGERTVPQSPAQANAARARTSLTVLRARATAAAGGHARALEGG